ncbi:MAG: hemerythrin domain-containing protein [Janthinobacterium lividum]
MLDTSTASKKAANKTTANTATTHAKLSAQIDAINLLIKEHAEVKAKFEAYEKLGDRATASKKKLVGEICQALTAHMIAEEEIFYPAAAKINGKEHDQVDEAIVEHAGAKHLIEQLLAMEPGDDLYDAKVKVLSEQIEHHVKEEEEEMFPRVRKAKLDLEAMGSEIESREEEVKAAA